MIELVSFFSDIHFNVEAKTFVKKHVNAASDGTHLTKLSRLCSLVLKSPNKETKKLFVTLIMIKIMTGYCKTNIIAINVMEIILRGTNDALFSEMLQRKFPQTMDNINIKFRVLLITIAGLSVAYCTELENYQNDYHLIQV